ncbi:MAG TPA: hypothetical protein VL172_11425 [Kofleriaceae bacterium]|nr:hypothetical protein [Kofleriaceae bacterium]
MNAVFELVTALPRPALGRLLRGRGLRGGGDPDRLRRRLADHFALDLAGLLNLATRDELELMAAAARLSAGGAIGELRARLWRHGAEREAGGPAWLGTALQPVPIVLRNKLVPPADPGGLSPPAPAYPRPVPPTPHPPPRTPHISPSAPEPDTLEDLLARADALLGVRLGPPTRDKGAPGARIAALLGVRERGDAEPDWRGEVEIKTVPVIRDRSGFWRVKEDPAVSMEHADAPAKLARVLWIARVADDADSPILSWFYQERDPHLAELQRRHLHTRPKGGAGATTRGWYLRKAFFAASGFLAALNGR